MADNNLIEQDHRSIKLRLGPMLGLKRFRCAAITLDGIELTHRIREGQFCRQRFSKGFVTFIRFTCQLPGHSKCGCQNFNALGRSRRAKSVRKSPILGQCDNACATYSSRLLILLWQMDSIHKKAPSDMSLRFGVSMVALRR